MLASYTPLKDVARVDGTDFPYEKGRRRGPEEAHSSDINILSRRAIHPEGSGNLLDSRDDTTHHRVTINGDKMPFEI